jgi:hypothetical protein
MYTKPENAATVKAQGEGGQYLWSGIESLQIDVFR